MMRYLQNRLVLAPWRKRQRADRFATTRITTFHFQRALHLHQHQLTRRTEAH